MEGGYGRGFPGVVPGGNSVYREEDSVQKNRFWAHFGHSEMRPSGYFDEPIVVMSRQVYKSLKWFSSSSSYLAAASGRGISSNLPVTFASDSALK
jgi:hypothetical protein